MTAPPATSGTSGQASLPELLVEQFLSKAQRAPGAVVIRQRTADLWHELTAGDVALAIRRVSRALLGAGVAAQDYVLVVGAASAEWLVAELACQSIGAASVVVADDAASATLPASRRSPRPTNPRGRSSRFAVTRGEASRVTASFFCDSDACPVPAGRSGPRERCHRAGGWCEDQVDGAFR